MNAIDLLLQQHQQVEGFFQRVEGASPDERITLMGRIAEALTLHAALEEQYFYPLLRQYNMGDEVDRSYQEHAEVKQMISRMLQMKHTDAQLMPLLDQLMMSVRQHVDVEERQIIPHLRNVIDARLLESVGKDMMEAMSKLRNTNLLQVAERQEMPVIH